MAISNSRSRNIHFVRLFVRLFVPFSTSATPLNPKPEPRLFIIDPEVKRLAKLRRFSEAEAVLEEKKKDKTKTSEESYCASLIVSYAFANMLDRATATFDQMAELGFTAPRTTLSLNALLTSYSHSGEHARVPDLLADLSKKHSITPDAVSYSILVNSLCLSGEPEKAREVLKEMEEKMIEISTFTYTPIIDEFYKKKKPEEAENTWAEMVGRGCIPDVVVFNVKAKYLGNHRMPEELLELMEEMNKAGLKPDIATYNFLLTCYCKNGKFLEAKELYRTLKEKNVRPNDATYRNLSRLLCKNGDFDMGFKVCKDGIMKRKIPDFGPAKMLVKGLMKSEKEKEAKWLSGVLKEKFPPTFIDKWKEVEEELGLITVDATEELIQVEPLAT